MKNYYENGTSGAGEKPCTHAPDNMIYILHKTVPIGMTTVIINIQC